MAFQKPRILSDTEANIIRGKCLVAKASAEELMQLIGHFDLVEQKLRDALETLSDAMPDRVYVYGKYGERKWSNEAPDDVGNSEVTVVDFKELLDA